MAPWYEEAEFYHIYPIGLTGAPRKNESEGTVHRFSTLEQWLPHIADLGCTAIYHNAFDLDNVFLRQAICLLIGSAQFVVEPEPVPLPWNPESAAVFACLRPFDRSLPLQRSPVPVPVHRRTGGDDRHILHLSRHKIRKTGRKSLSAEEVSGFHSHL